MYIIYKHTCVPTGKSYIGFTKKGVEKRWSEHVSMASRRVMRGKNKFQNAILKYGVDSFIHEIIFQSESRSEALSMEKYLIEQLGTRVCGYNMALGGSGGIVRVGPLSKKHKNNISKSLRGKTFSEERKLNLSIAHSDVSKEKNPFYGKKHDEETRRRMSGLNHPSAIKVSINGVEYSSIKEASIKLGVGVSKLHRRIKKLGTVIEKLEIEHQTAIPICINGIKYRSVKSAASILNINPTKLYRWVKKHGTVINKSLS